MDKRRGRGGLLRLASLLLICALLTGPVLAAAGDGSETATSQEAVSETQTDEGTDSTQASESEDTGEESTDREDTEATGGEDTPADPEPTLEELRDELLAILGGGEEAAAIQANIDRLIALGDPNGNLRTYLEGMIRLRQLQYEQEQLQATLDQLETADETIGTIGQAATALENPDEVLSRIETEISDQAARLMESAGYDGTGDLAALAARALEYLDEGRAGADSADVAAILLFTWLQEGEFLTDTGFVTASDAIASHFSNIAGRYQGLSSQERQTLEIASEDIAGRANNAQSMDPSTLVAAGGTLALTHPVFTYSGTIMISLADAAAFLGGEVVEMENNAAVVIQAPGVVLEMTKGTSDAYLSDKLLKMDQPVLSFDKVCYLPLDTVLQCCGMERLSVGSYELLYAAPES